MIIIDPHRDYCEVFGTKFCSTIHGIPEDVAKDLFWRLADYYNLVGDDGVVHRTFCMTDAVYIDQSGPFGHYMIDMLLHLGKTYNCEMNLHTLQGCHIDKWLPKTEAIE